MARSPVQDGQRLGVSGYSDGFSGWQRRYRAKIAELYRNKDSFRRGIDSGRRSFIARSACLPIVGGMDKARVAGE
jgi:hypothetical protein